MLALNPGAASRTAAVAVVLAGSLVSGGWLLERGATRGPTTEAEAARLFDDVFGHVSRNYVDSLDDTRLYRMAVEGMLYELEDPYTTLLPPEKLGQLQESTSGNYAGVGLQVDLRDGWIVVITPVPGSPADRAGIQPGDRVLEIDGRVARGWTLEEATRAFRGRAGTALSIRIERPGGATPVLYRLVRRALHQSAVRRVAMLPNGVGYVDLKAFSDSTEREVTRSVNALLRRGMKSLVLDLRSNPGGLLDQGLRVADLFLDPGQRIMSLRGRAPATTREYVDSTKQRWPDLPVIVLVNDRSASAAEIVAGALQDHDRAVIIGQPTYGKGSAQTIIPLGEAGGIKITTSRWYTPSGRSISRRADRDGEEDDASRAADQRRYRTTSGRVVYDGGGITPDVYASDTVWAQSLRILQTALGPKGSLFRDAVSDYASALKGRGEVASPQFMITDRMLDEVWRRMTARGVDIPRAVYDDAEAVVSALLANDIALYVFGQEAEFRRRVARDVTIAAALELATGARSQRVLLDRATARQAVQRAALAE